MTRNLVVCFDGTNNQFGPENTSVVRLAQVLDRDPARQGLYYDPGVGTLPEPGIWTKVGKRISEIFGLAFGSGLSWKIQEAYSFLMDIWEPGDIVFIFGFSRGAYSARVLAGLLHALGLLPRGNQNLVPYVIRLFGAVSPEGTPGGAGANSRYEKLCDDFRWSFARQMSPDDDDRRFPVHFLGLWDTVSSVGWVWDPVKFPFTVHNPSVEVIRHAVSLDERRALFRQNLMEQMSGQDLKQVWFPGVHCDVGGGYPEAGGGLWRIPFEWILGEAQAAGLQVNSTRLCRVLHRTTASPAPWNDPMHESLKGLWWLAEVFPKFRWDRTTSSRVPEMGLGRHRFVHKGELMHESVLRRVRETAYSPCSLSPAFIQTVRALASVPDTMAYRPEGELKGVAP